MRIGNEALYMYTLIVCLPDVQLLLLSQCYHCTMDVDDVKSIKT